MNIEEFNKKDILGDFEYELNKLCRSCIGTATEIKIKQQPLIHLFEKIVWSYEKEKEKNKKLDKENQGLFELYNFNDSSLLTKILKDYKNIIKKQSKEIEEYKKQLDLDYVDKHFVPIERYYQLEKEIEELNNRNNKLMEELDLTTVYISGVYDGEKKVEDKIKAKIEEQDETKQYWTDEVKDILKSLLRKEQ